MTAGVPDTFDAYAATRDDARFSSWLRRRAEPAWGDVVDHRFVRELADGSVDDDVFERYLVQDYAFVGTLVSAFGYAVGGAPTMDAKASLTGFLAALTDEEDDYFERSFDALDVPERDRRDPALADVTEAFEDLLLRASLRGGYAETLAVLVPAEWTYLTWATGITGRPDPFHLREWIDLHASEAFGAFVERLRAELDAHGAAASERRQRRLDRLFGRTVRLERAFFDHAYRGGDRDGTDRGMN